MMSQEKTMSAITREDLISICERSVVSYGNWSDRDS